MFFSMMKKSANQPPLPATVASNVAGVAGEPNGNVTGIQLWAARADGADYRDHRDAVLLRAVAELAP
jgi:hypothetical protein